MELITTAKEIYESAKTIQKVYNVSKKMKTVAESEGKDQIFATKDLAGTSVNINEKREFSSNESKKEGDLDHDNDLHLSRGDFVEELEPSHVKKEEHVTDRETFVGRLSKKNASNELYNPQGLFVDKLSSIEKSGSDIQSIDEIYNISQNKEIKDTVKSNLLDSEGAIDSISEMKPERLTEQEKQDIKGKTGWSDKIVDAIRSKEEAQVYIDAGLVEGKVNSKPALFQPNIDGNECNEPKWPDWSNKDLAEEGYPPRDKNGHPFELHHIGQNPDSPLAELTYEQHHCDGNFKILHTFDESSIDRIQFNKERREYWSERSKSL